MIASTRTRATKPGAKRGKRRKPRQSYKQNTRLYDLAQAVEPRNYLRLLREVCDEIPDEFSFQKEKGRPRPRLGDVAFAMGFKLYFQLPGRRMGSPRNGGLLVDLYNAGYLSQPLHWNTIGHYFRDARMSEVLEYLIEMSALPLVPVEQGKYDELILPVAKFKPGDISSDSIQVAGSARTKKGSKRSRGQREHQIIKAHLTTGNRSNIVPACAIEGPGAHESPLVPGLIHTTAKSFKVGNVFGDRAYSTRRAYNAVEAVGGQGWFRFKTTHKGRGRDAFARFFHWVAAHPDEFWDEYFKRNNAESTFSAILRVLLHGLRHKTGTLRSKKVMTSMKNEFYTAVLAHNIRVVNRFMILVGFEPNFAPDEPDAMTSQTMHARHPDGYQPAP